MTANAQAKLKLLHVHKMLMEETDAEHGLTMADILERLAAEGITAERKGIYRDIKLLREIGVDVRKYERNPVEYAIEHRGFSLAELMLLVDAVQSSRFITQKQCNLLVGNIKSLASRNQCALLDKRIHVAGRIKSKNDSVFASIDVIHEAMRQRKKVSFLYYKHGCDGAPVVQRDGKPYVLTPVKVVYADGFYYLEAYSDRHEGFADYRIDRMRSVAVADEAATRAAAIADRTFEDADYQYFGRMGGERATVTLAVAPDKMDIIVDRFGAEAQVTPRSDGGAHAVVPVKVSEQFFGWVAGLGGTVTIAKPERVRRAYRDYLRSLLED